MNPLSRRRFLEESILAATAALSAPSISAAAGNKQPGGPNERLAIAVIGTGSRGAAHVRAFAGRKDCQVRAARKACLHLLRRTPSKPNK